MLAEYRRINDAIWALYRRNGITAEALAVERFRELLRAVGEADGGARDLSAAYVRELSRRGDLLPGCRSTLQRLSRRFRLGAVTNGLDRVQRARLRAARLDSRFETVVTSESAGYAKPDPRIIQMALADLGVSAREAVYVGDDLDVDGRAAAAAGVTFIWLSATRRPPGTRAVRAPDLPALDRLLDGGGL